MREDRTVLVHDDVDRPEVRAVAPARAAAMRRLAADMADVTAIRPSSTAQPNVYAGRTPPGSTNVVVTLSAQVLNDWTLRTWTITSADGTRPDDEVAILLPRVRGVAANHTPDVDQLHRLAVILTRAADVLERPDDHPTELDWIRAVATMLQPLRGQSVVPGGMMSEADHISASPVSTSLARVVVREEWRATGRSTCHDLDLPDGMLLTTIGEGHRPTLEAIETTLGDAHRHDPMDVLRSLAKLDGDPVWKAHRERTRHP
jgi:hypothetical protein